MALTDIQIAGCFNRGLGRCYRVRLIGGAAEPFYVPAGGGGYATIRYRHDYPASALHELAHWCIAGAERRKRPDYGYWYRPPPRSAAEQQAFCRAELPVQALEAQLSAASGLRFRVSVDDVTGTTDRAVEFQQAIDEYLRGQQNPGRFPRAQRLLGDLQRLNSLLAEARGAARGGDGEGEG